MAVEIEQVRDVTDEIVAAFARLIPQLSRSAAPVTVQMLRSVVDCPANTLLVARLDGRVVGTLTLVVFPIPTGVRAWIEDVVVDAEARGQQAGAALTRAALNRAAELGARTVDLTSRRSREVKSSLPHTRLRRAGLQPSPVHPERACLITGQGACCIPRR
jgi:GNAT superfamily N-acetyltransferase